MFGDHYRRGTKGLQKLIIGGSRPVALPCASVNMFFGILGGAQRLSESFCIARVRIATSLHALQASGLTTQAGDTEVQPLPIEE